MLIKTAQTPPSLPRPQTPASLEPDKPSDPSEQVTLSRDSGDLGDRTQQMLKGGGIGLAANVAAAGYPSTWLHEMGHAKMIELLYENGNPQVEVFPFKGGVTRWQLSPLSPLGEKLGSNGSRAMVAAAGTMVDMGVAMTTFGAGFKLRKKHPVVGAALMGYGAMTVTNSIAYAASAVGKDFAQLASQGHDFANLAVRAGIHPIASIALMASVLPAQYAVMKYLENRSEG